MASNGNFELNEALEKSGGLGKYHYWLFLKMVPCSVSGVIIVNVLTYILPAIVCQMAIPKYEQGLLFSSVYMGMIVGGLIWGAMADIIGRKATLLVLLFFTAFFEYSALSIFTYWQLFFIKVCSGFMSSGIMTTSYTYASEFVTLADKDRNTMCLGMITALGYFLQPLIAIFTLPLQFELVIIPSLLEMNGWKLFQFICALIPTLGFFSLLLFVRESPAFLLRQGHNKEALEVVKEVYSKNKGQPPDTFEVTGVYLQEGAVEEPQEKSTFLDQLKLLFSRPYVFTVIIVVMCQFITMGAFGALRSHLSTIITMALGIGQSSNTTSTTDEDQALCILFQTQTIFKERVKCDARDVKLKPEIYICTTIIGFFICFSFLPMIRLIKTIGKTLSFIILHYVGATCISVVPFVTANIAVLLLTIFSLSMQNCITIAVGLIVGRIPTTIRGLTVSIVLIGGRIGVILGSMLLPVMTDISCPVGFWSIAFINLLALPLIFLYSRQKDPMQETAAIVSKTENKEK